MLRRPPPFDVVLGENAQVYASYTNVGGEWMGGLFAKRDLQAGETLGRYTGREYDTASAAYAVADQAYMFSARSVRDRRRRIVVDGNPALYANLAGYANYAEGSAANAHFVDMADRAGDTDLTTNVVLQAAAPIPSGTEIRADYDMGNRNHPFRDQMIAKGVPRSALRDGGYASRRWVHPNLPVGRAVALENRLARDSLQPVGVVRPYPA